MVQAKCPQCKKPIQWEGNAFRPFCSERCKLIDLGKWISEEYKIPTGEPADLESLKEVLQKNEDES